MNSEICNFYQTHTNKETLEYFHISSQTFYKILEEEGIPKRGISGGMKLSKERNRFTSPPTSKGKKGYNDGYKNYRLTDDEAKNFNGQLYLGFIPMDEKTKRNKRIKTEQTNLEKYGDKNYNNQEKRLKSFKSRYGTDNPMKLNEIKEKRDKTNLIRYGVTSYSQTVEFNRKAGRKYTYDGLTFDSSYELSLWIFAKDHNEEIIRCPVKLKYRVNGLTRYYFPDFLYKGQLIEIKGNHLQENKKLVLSPFEDKNDFNSSKVMAKQKCIEDNNVVILTKEDLKFAFDYIKEKYGKNYLKNFRNARLDGNI